MQDFSSADNGFVNRVHHIIDENIDNESFTVDILSKDIGISRSMLHRKLKRFTGKSASELILELRLGKARDLLEKTELTSAEIAYRSGFSSPSYFNKAFKKHYQISPGELRKGSKPKVGHAIARNSRLPGKLRYPSLIFVGIILAAALTWAGFHFSKGKADRSAFSIAILPFDNLSDVETTQYFADGIVEDLLNRLSTIKDLKVISRTSSEMFREKGEMTVCEIGKLLGVNYIVEGAVQRVEDDIRISIQLIDAKTDNHVFSNQYNRRLSDFFQIQSEIAGEIARELSITLTHTELGKVYHAGTTSLQAFEYYQLGRFHSSKRRVDEFHKGIEYYERAIEADSNYAQAFAGLADNYYLLVLYSQDDSEKHLKKAYEMAEKALDLDPDLAEAHTVLGDIYKAIDWEWGKAEKEYQLALCANPNYSTTHQYYAELLTYLGRFDEAREQMNKAIELDPYSSIIRYFSSKFYYDQEQFDKALTEAMILYNLDSGFSAAPGLIAYSYMGLGNDSAALDWFNLVGKQQGLWEAEKADSVFHKGGGMDAVIRWRLEVGKAQYPGHDAFYYGLVGEDEKALESLERAFEAKSLDPLRTSDWVYKPLRSNPRFMAIREKMDLPQLEP